MVDIGVLSLIVLASLIMWIRAGIRLLRFLKRKEEPLVYPIVVLVLWSVILFSSSFFEFKHQLAHFVATSVTRDVSGNDKAIAQCKRRAADSFDFMNFAYAGFVNLNSANVSRLRTNTCSDFASWLLSDKKHASRDELFALHVIIHEAVHVGGQYNEAITECKAMDKYENIAIKLGASSKEAARMSNEFKTQIYPHVPSQYLMDCSKR